MMIFSRFYSVTDGKKSSQQLPVIIRLLSLRERGCGAIGKVTASSVSARHHCLQI